MSSIAVTGIVAASSRRAGVVLPAPVYSSVGTETQAVSVSSVTANRPATVNSGDLLLMIMAFRAAPATVATPSGWTKIVDAVWGSSDTFRAYLFWKVAGGSEPSTYTVTSSATGQWQISVARITGANATTPVDQVAGQKTVAGTTIVCPTVTTSGANRLVGCVTFQPRNANVTPPGSLTERFDRTYVTATLGQAWGDTVQSAAAATGTFTWAQPDPTGREPYGVTIAIAP